MESDPMLRSISEFCPRGTQIKSPSGFSFDPNDVCGLEAQGRDRSNFSLTVHLRSGSAVRVTFYDNTDGSAAEHFALMRNIEKAVNSSEQKAK